MPGGQDKSVSVDPVRILRIKLEMPSPQHMRHGCRAQRQTSVSTLGLFHAIKG